MASQKLQDAFNECGDKLIDIKEVSKLELASLSKLDTVRIFAACANSKRLVAKAAQMADFGAYLQSNDGRTFVTVKAYQEQEEALERVAPSKLKGKLGEKADNATADAIRKAIDYSGQRQSLGLKPAY